MCTRRQCCSSSFVPILFISFGYRYLNKADPDTGTTFAWTTRAFGPWVGWINGWAIFVADVIVMASLSVIAAQYTYLLFNWNYAYNSPTLIIVGAVIWIAIMTWICYRGIELSARDPGLPAQCRDPDPRGVLDRGALQDVQRDSVAGLDARELVVVQPVCPVL